MKFHICADRYGHHEMHIQCLSPQNQSIQCLTKVSIFHDLVLDGCVLGCISPSTAPGHLSFEELVEKADSRAQL